MPAGSEPVISLRPLVVTDAAVFARWARDPEFSRCAGWDPRLGVDEVTAHHELVATDPPAGLLRLAVDEDGALVGYVDLLGADQETRELGFVIGGRERWGRGLGTAAARAAVAHASRVLGVRALVARVDHDNHASLRLLTRLGFREVESDPASGRCRLRLTR